MAVVFQTEEKIMRLFECGTLVPGCAWHTRADNDAEVVRRAVEHLKTAHGETTIRENMVDNIKARIRDEATAA
jgi:predicted small metal-binding protein